MSIDTRKYFAYNHSMDEIKEIFQNHKGDGTWADLLCEINKAPRLSEPVTENMLRNYGSGRRMPEYYFMVYLSMFGTPTAQNLAMDVLRAMKPELWK